MSMMTVTHSMVCDECLVYDKGLIVITEDGVFCYSCAVHKNIICGCNGLKDQNVEYCPACERAIEEEAFERREQQRWEAANL